jgi:hypothetical protein
VIHLLRMYGKLDSECNGDRSVRFLYECTLFQWSNHNSPVSMAAQTTLTQSEQILNLSSNKANTRLEQIANKNCDTRALDCGPEQLYTNWENKQSFAPSLQQPPKATIYWHVLSHKIIGKRNAFMRSIRIRLTQSHAQLQRCSLANGSGGIRMVVAPMLATTGCSQRHSSKDATLQNKDAARGLNCWVFK